MTMLGEMHAASFASDPKHLGFVLARYQFVAKMLIGADCVMEVGCGDGTGARVVRPVVKSLIGIDREVQYNYPGTFWKWDILEGCPDFRVQLDAVFALDFLEHIDRNLEDLALHNMLEHLGRYGTCIIGMPSLESQPYASELSKKYHVNCKTEYGLRQTMSTWFHNVYIFGLNDSTLHTGFGPLCQYRLALCTGKR